MLYVIAALLLILVLANDSARALLSDLLLLAGVVLAGCVAIVAVCVVGWWLVRYPKVLFVVGAFVVVVALEQFGFDMESKIPCPKFLRVTIPCPKFLSRLSKGRGSGGGSA